MKIDLWTMVLRALAGATFVAAATGLVSCEQDLYQGRSEYINVYTDPSVPEAVSSAYVSVQGGTATFYVDANVDFTASWEDGQTTPWVSVTDYSAIDPASGLRMVTLDVDRRTASGYYYTRRTGMLILSSTDGSLYYNTIVSVHQGAVARVSGTFSFLSYGKTDPRFDDDEVSIDNWTTTQKNYGFTSTTAEGEEVTHCYGKYGYIQLGDDNGHGADLISPYTNSLSSDSLLMVSFQAVAHVDFYTGEKDDNRITVEVLDGGVITDFSESGSTSIDFEVPYLDYSDEDFPSTMWDGSNFLVFVSNAGLNSITSNTRIRISCGSLTDQSETCSRIYIDNFYIHRLASEEMEYYFSANNGSGIDQILGTNF